MESGSPVWIEEEIHRSSDIHRRWHAYVATGRGNEYALKEDTDAGCAALFANVSYFRQSSVFGHARCEWTRWMPENPEQEDRAAGPSDA